MDTTAELLVSQLEALLSSSSSSSSSKAGSPTDISVPTLQQFYQLGLVLYNVTAGAVTNTSSRSNHPSRKLPKDLLGAYEHLIDVLPDAALTRICSGLNTTTDMLLRLPPNVGMVADDDNGNNDLVRTCQALAGLWVHSPRLCRLAYTTQWISTLASLYDRFMVSMMARKTTQGITTTTSWTSPQDAILSSISCLMLDGLLDQKHSFQSLSLEGKSENGDGDSIEERLLDAIQAMDDQSIDCLRDLQQWQSQQEGPLRTLESAVQNINSSSSTDDDDIQQQREYILNMLESARQASSQPSAVSRSTAKNKTGGSTSSKAASTAKSASASVDELDRRIQQVKQILPHLGEGFIETALSLNQGDVEATMSMLLLESSQYPATLQVMDPSLPRRRRETTTVEEAALSAEARQVVKERVALERQKEAERYRALLYVSQQEELEEEQRRKEQDQQEDADTDMSFNVRKNEQFEYDDDYDDQYDEMDIRLGGADDGFTLDGGNDFEKVKLYNQIAREGEAEDSFWEANRNTNRAAGAGKKNTGDNGGENKQYRGSDKIKGGKVIGPDGKIVRNPGGAGGKKNKRRNNNNNTNNNSTNHPGQQQGSQNANGNGKSAGRVGEGNDSSNDNGSNAQPNGNGSSSNNKRTKPKSNNRLNRQRDNKQKKQGTFGVQG